MKMKNRRDGVGEPAWPYDGALGYFHYKFRVASARLLIDET